MCVACKVIIDSGASQGAAISFAEDLGKTERIKLGSLEQETSGGAGLRAELLAYARVVEKGCDALQAADVKGHAFPDEVKALVNKWCTWADDIDSWHYDDMVGWSVKGHATSWAKTLYDWRHETTDTIRKFAESVGGLG